MKAFEQLERLQRINEIIKNECTGTPEEFAQKLNISRRQLYAELEYLCDLGINIKYSRTQRTFLFSEGQKLEIKVGIKVISNEVSKNIFGGFSINQFQCFFSARKEDKFAYGLAINL